MFLYVRWQMDPRNVLTAHKTVQSWSQGIDCLSVSSGTSTPMP